MVAIRLPPKVGRVIFSRPVSSSISSFVQSAVSPQPTLADTLGARSRPIVVAPNSTTSGFSSLMIATVAFTYGSVRYFSSLSSSW